MTSSFTNAGGGVYSQGGDSFFIPQYAAVHILRGTLQWGNAFFLEFLVFLALLLLPLLQLVTSQVDFDS